MARTPAVRALYLGAFAAAAMAATPSAAAAQFRQGYDRVGYADGGIAAAIKEAGAPREIRDVYAARGYRSIWIRNGAIGPEAETLVRLIETARLDGLDPGDYKPRALISAIKRAAESGSPKALAKAELMLSRSFATLARDMRLEKKTKIYVA